MTQKASAANPNPQPPYILALDVGTSSWQCCHPMGMV
jgi:hypothetical protein